MMKKTLLALTVAALSAGSAQAFTAYENKDTGTKIDFSGSARIKWESTSRKDTNAQGVATRQHENHAVDNNGTRFGFKVTQELGNDFYALGRVEWRFRGEAPSQHDFDHIYTRQLYAGIGHKQFGELTYGNMTTITDEIKQTDLPNTYSLSDGLLDYAARRAVQYTYKGDYGNNKVKFGAYYGGASKRGDTNLDLANRRKNVWGVGAIFNHKISDDQKITVATGLTREMFANRNESSFSQTAYSLDFAYQYQKTTLGLDLERQVTKNQHTYSSNVYTGNAKRTRNEVRAVAHQALNDNWNVYTMYAYKTSERENAAAKEKANQFMVGTEYYVFKQDTFKIKPFVEWQATRTKNVGNAADTKRRDLKTVVGLRAYW